MQLTGTEEERIAAAIAFAKAHGGFKHCRLFAEMNSRAPLDLTRITEQENCANNSLSDSNTAALLLEILEKATPKRHHETTLPCRIEFVEE